MIALIASALAAEPPLAVEVEWHRHGSTVFANVRTHRYRRELADVVVGE